MPRVFISHASADSAFVAAEIIPFLREHGVETWSSYEDIAAAKDWDASIRQALEACEWFMVAVSPAAVQSVWVKTEVHWAMQNREGRIIPVVIAPSESTNLHLRLGPLQHVDFTSRSDLARQRLLAIWQPSEPERVGPRATQTPKTGVDAPVSERFADLVFDLSDGQTWVYHPVSGALISERSAVAVDKRTHVVVASGTEIDKLGPASRDQIEIRRPVVNGSVADWEIAAALLRRCVASVSFTGPYRAILTTATSLTQVHRAAVVAAAYAAGAEEVYLAERVLSAMASSGVELSERAALIVVHVGETATECAVIEGNSVGATATAPVGTVHMDAEIIAYCKKMYNLQISTLTAQDIRNKAGSTEASDDPVLTIRGKNLIEGILKDEVLRDHEIRETVHDAVEYVVRAVVSVVERAPVQTLSAIAERGILLTGPGAEVRGLAGDLADASHLPVRLSESPALAVVTGATRLMQQGLLRSEAASPPSIELLAGIRRVSRGVLHLGSQNLVAVVGAHTTALGSIDGKVWQAPSLVARHVATGAIAAVGDGAVDVSHDTERFAVEPIIRGGEITSIDGAAALLRVMIRAAHGGRRWASPHLLMPAAHRLTRTARDAFSEAARDAGAARSAVKDAIVCAAIGVGLPLMETPEFVLYLCADFTEVAYVGAAGVTFCLRPSVTGRAMDEAIEQYVRKEYSVAILRRHAKAIKEEIGSAFPLDERLSMEVTGQHLTERTPRTVTVSDEEIRRVLYPFLIRIVDAVRFALDNATVDATVRVVNGGITATGGGALLRNLDKLLREETGLPVRISENCVDDVMIGACRALERVGWKGVEKTL